MNNYFVVLVFADKRVAMDDMYPTLKEAQREADYYIMFMPNVLSAYVEEVK